MSNPQTLTQQLLLAVAKKLDLTNDNCPEVKAMEEYLVNNAKQAAARKAKKDNKKDNKKNKKDNKKQDKKRAEKVVDKKAEEEAAAKLLKKAIKEGGKKGQDLQGMNALGGVSFFHIAVDTPAGSPELLKACMQGMNKKVDPDADDRKGGAGNIAKTIFTFNDKSVYAITHVPKELESKLSFEDWTAQLLKSIDGVVVEQWGDDESKCMLWKADGSVEKQTFPIKMRDFAMDQGFHFLVSKELIRDDDSSDDDANYAEDLGIEW